ncbi:EAL domain-containing protein [Vibrio cholerae]|uniref:EAL domain-containing protein n=1 Tax=Vibrio cholerae TaxID=666 RepID=UPI0029C2CA93|nr:EAL domain-containing protein [Vibrio cholerae]MDX5049768.1 EAL domain-containing protein [Vibrio cholerae]
MTILKIKQWHINNQKLGFNNWSLVEKVSAGVIVSGLFLAHPLPGFVAGLLLPIIYPITSSTLSRKKLKRFIKENKVSSYYQAKFDTERNVCGCEALARITEGEVIIYPNEFIELALRTGQIAEIDKLMLLNSIQDLKRWIEKGLVSKDFVLSFNVDRATLLNNRIVDDIISIIINCEVPASMLEIEVTERTIDSDKIEDKQLVLSNIMRIKETTGIRLAIDDFTLGHSSAETLLTLPVDTIKIDRFFVTIENAAKFKFIKLISSFAVEMGCKTVLEGIETEEQHEHFSQISINEFQGFLFHKPSNNSDFEKMLISKLQ